MLKKRQIANFTLLVDPLEYQIVHINIPIMRVTSRLTHQHQIYQLLRSIAQAVDQCRLTHVLVYLDILNTPGQKQRID